MLRQAQHERDLPFPFALSLSKGKSTLSNALLRQPPGERAGVRGDSCLCGCQFLKGLSITVYTGRKSAGLRGFKLTPVSSTVQALTLSHRRPLRAFRQRHRNFSLSRRRPLHNSVHRPKITPSPWEGVPATEHDRSNEERSQVADCIDRVVKVMETVKSTPKSNTSYSRPHLASARERAGVRGEILAYAVATTRRAYSQMRQDR